MRDYQDTVYSTAARLTGNDAQAEDIAQEVFLRAYEHYGELSQSATAGGWLKTVTTNLTLNYLTRHRQRRRLFSEMTNDDASPGSAPQIERAGPDTVLAELASEERCRLVDDALRRLPEHQRLALVLYHFEDFSYQEIAIRLDASLAKVKTDIHRARAALLQILVQAGLCASDPRDSDA